MNPLNLPPYNFKIKEEEGQQYIFDTIRKKYLVLTPEEWVRQHFIQLLSDHFNYPKSLISCEAGLTYNKRQKRSDILVYDNNGKPFLLVECKAPHIALNQKTLNQVSSYNKIIEAPYWVVTNGMKTLCWSAKENKQLSQLPLFPS